MEHFGQLVQLSNVLACALPMLHSGAELKSYGQALKTGRPRPVQCAETDQSLVMTEMWRGRRGLAEPADSS